MNKALLDTDIYSEILKNKNPAILTCASAYLDQYEQFTLSVLTVIESVAGYLQAGRDAQLPALYAALATEDIPSVEDMSLGRQHQDRSQFRQ